MPKDYSWKRQFASDTVAGVCPEAMRALQAANEVGFVPSYGDDEEFTEPARQSICRVFGRDPGDCRVFFVSSGTVANALALTAICQSFDGVLCHPLSHLEHDEANAPEYLTGGAKLLAVPGNNGKMDAERLHEFLDRGHGHHSVRPRMISVTQATEFGTVYSLDEVAAIVAAKTEMESVLQRRFEDPQFRLHLHMDGARLANAVVALDCEPGEMIRHIDVLSFGGSKNGGPPTEAIVFFDAELARDFAWRVKQTGQLTSKLRYLSAPWLGLLQDDVWLRNGRHANRQATTLCRRFQELGLEPAAAVEANTVFVRFSKEQAERLQQAGWEFYPFQFPEGTAYRFVCNWSTTDEAIADLLGDVKSTRS